VCRLCERARNVYSYRVGNPIGRSALGDSVCNTMQRILNGGSLSSEMGDMIKLLPSSVEIEWRYPMGYNHRGYATTQVLKFGGLLWGD